MLTSFHRKIFFIITLLLILPLISSCLMDRQYDTAKILEEMLKSEKSLPAGSRFTTKSSPGAPDHLSEGLLTALYGTDKLPEVFKRTEEISLWLSSGLQACEFGVFRCSDRRDAREIAELCLGRLDTMRHFINLNTDKLSLDLTSIKSLKNATVTIHGSYVIVAVSERADTAISAASAMIS